MRAQNEWGLGSPASPRPKPPLAFPTQPTIWEPGTGYRSIGKTLDSNDQNQVAGQRFSLKQWFAGGAQSRGLRKPGCGHGYLRFLSFHCLGTPTWPP